MKIETRTIQTVRMDILTQCFYCLSCCQVDCLVNISEVSPQKSDTLNMAAVQNTIAYKLIAIMTGYCIQLLLLCSTTWQIWMASSRPVMMMTSPKNKIKNLRALQQATITLKKPKRRIKAQTPRRTEFNISLSCQSTTSAIFIIIHQLHINTPLLPQIKISGRICIAALKSYIEVLYYYSYMLARIVTRQLQFTLKNRFAFGGSHGHQDYSVKIDKESPWIKYNSDPKFVCIQGVQDVNYPLQPPLKDNPFQHLQNQPFFSWNRQVYTEPWYHEDSHEPYNSLPDRGYVNGEDPLETRHISSIPMYTTAMVIATVLGLYALADPYLQTSEAIVHQQVVSRRYVTETLEQKNKKLNQLKARESELLKATSE